jgi:hypothetical protein
VPAPVCATSPVTIAVNVVNPGVVNTRSFPSTASSDAGTTGPAGIGFPSPGAVATTPMLPTPRPTSDGNGRSVTRPGGNRSSAPAGRLLPARPEQATPPCWLLGEGDLEVEAVAATRIRDAYMAVMAQLGVTAGMEPDAFLAAMAEHKEQDPALAAVLTAIKSTVKGGVGKLRERPQGARHQFGEPWPALRRPTWSPHIRAAIISSARVNMHRKMLAWASKADLWPLAVLSDCVVYPSPGPTPLDFVPTTPDGKPLPGGFRLGVSPGMVKLEGSQPLLWAVQLMDQQLNPARHIKGADAATDGE